MDILKINTLVDELRSLKSHGQSRKRLTNKVREMKTACGGYLQLKLEATYKNFFPFDDPVSLDRYFSSEGVPVEENQLGEPRYKVSIKSNPLRIVLKDNQEEAERIAWEMIG